MAGKGRNAIRIETDIEKSREESNWKRVIELAEQLKAKSANQGKSLRVIDRKLKVRSWNLFRKGLKLIRLWVNGLCIQWNIHEI